MKNIRISSNYPSLVGRITAMPICWSAHGNPAAAGIRNQFEEVEQDRAKTLMGNVRASFSP